jgi:CrcB protein
MDSVTSRLLDNVVHQQSLPDEVGAAVQEESVPVDPDVLPSERSAPRTRANGWVSVLRSRWDILLVVAAGGALGSIARWGLGRAVPWSADRFPWATFLENVSGALALGILMVLLLDVWPPSRYARPFLGVGVLGGYTTFSTYALESRDLLAGGRPGLAFTYLGVTLLAGLVAVWLGGSCVRLVARLGRSPKGGGPPSISPEPRSRP